MDQKKKGVFRAGINRKLLGSLIPIIVIVLSAILLQVHSHVSDIVKEKSESLLVSNSNSVVNDVKAWMNKVITTLNVERDTMEYSSMSEEEELAYIRHTAGRSDAFPAGIYAATLEGKLYHASFVPGPDYNVFEKSWYQDGLKSEEFQFGSVYFDEDSQNYVVGASGALKDREGKVCGVAAADIYLNAISEIVKNVQLEKSGRMFLVDTNTNAIIGHEEESLVGTVLDQQEGAMYAYVSELLRAGSMGLQDYKDADGSRIYINLSPIPDSKWVGVAFVPEKEVMADLNALTKRIAVIAVVSVVILFFLIFFLVRRTIIKPVKEIDLVARRIADGKLNETIACHSRDEFGELAANFNKTVARLRDYVGYIDEISRVLNEIADGRLDFSLTHDYKGEFSRVKTALNHISASLNETLRDINTAADQVSCGADQMSGGAQALSQGATQQASSVEELAAAVNQISEQIRRNAESAGQANEKARSVGDGMLESNRQMELMIQAMREISKSSGEIEKIVKTIEDIAFQTNILALNASVEAARAGAAGKGFAVVAEEVRTLAGKSGEASQNTTALIGESLRAVKNGARIADITAEALLKAVEGAREVTSSIEGISEASLEQARVVSQVTLGLDQISKVVQTNSATAEESAAASEELSSQAQLLKELTGRFQLKEEGGKY